MGNSSKAPKMWRDGGNDRSFRLTCLVMLCSFTVHSMLLVAVPLYSRGLGLSSLEIGFVVGVPYALPLLIAMPASSLIAQAGGRASLVFGGIAFLSALLLMATFFTFWGMVVGQILVGVGHMSMVLAAQTIISGLGAGRTLERYFGIYTMWLSVGQVIGPLLLGFVFDWYGVAPEILYVVAILLGIAGLLSLALSEKSVSSTKKRGHLGGLGVQKRLLKNNSWLQVSILVSLVAMVAISVYGSFFPLYLNELNISPTLLGLIVSLRPLAGVIVRWWASDIIAILGGRTGSTYFSVIALIIGMLVTGLFSSTLVLSVSAILIGIGVGLLMPISMVVLSENVESADRSGAFASRLMANRCINIITPLLFSSIIGLVGFGYAFLTFSFIVALFLFPLKGSLNRGSIPKNL